MRTYRHSAHTEMRDHLPMANVRKDRLTLLLWLVPLGALCLCAWFVYRDFVAAGPKITIYFKDAEGLEVKNTQLKYRGAIVGQVNDIALTPDHQKIKVSARLTGSARNIARQGSVFWIVRPEVKVGSISGLRTIISGEYIAVQPGDGPATNSFTGSDQEPITTRPRSLEITLTTTDLGSVQEQTPIVFRGVQVGEVLYYQLGPDSRDVLIHGSIWEQYAPLVRTESKFWNSGGLSFHAGLFHGIQLSAESPKAIISGGIEFATPPDSQTAATNGATFMLNEKPDDKWKAWAPEIKLQLPAEASMTNLPVGHYLH